MREIKFRAWDGHRMLYADTDSCHFIFFSRAGHIPWGLYDNVGGHRLVTGDQDAIFNSPGILMQFTGLKDKNGKEIWEGDVIRLSYPDETTELFTVVYTDYKARFQLRDKNDYGYGFDKSNRMEVIGNIHQNPELL